MAIRSWTEARVKRTRKSMQNRNLRTELRWMAKRIRTSARKLTQVAKSCTFHAHDLQTTCVDLRWVAKR